MKNFRLLFPLFLFVVSITGFVACEEDDAPLEPGRAILQLDGDNVSGPLRDGGTHRFAVRFDENRLTNFDGRNLTGIRVFIGQAPQGLELSAHVGGTSIPAGTGERRLGITGTIQSGGFFDYTFPDPLVIDASQPLWLVAEVELEGRQASIGCDANGNGVDGGDVLFSPGVGWTTFSDETGENVNWNIRGLVE